MYIIQVLLPFFLLPANFAHLSEEDNNIFPYKSLSNCKKSEMYDLDYFKCVACDSGQNLVPANDHFSCECASKTDTDVIYDSSRGAPICSTTKCENCTKPKCDFKFVDIERNGTVQKSVQIFYDRITNCTCDAKFIYYDYCISKSLLKNFQNFNSGEQQIYKDLKFIAFFCKVLRNTTACNHMANLCISSFYSLKKNSPCNFFILAQATDAAEYGGEDLKNIRPFLFYKKGKETVQNLDRIIDYPLRDRLEFFGTTYSRDGVIRRMGSINQQHINLCNHFSLPKYRYIKFAQNIDIQCRLSLENIIDFAKIYANNHFLNLFLNYTIEDVRYLHPVPILVRNAMSNTENSRPEDWQLVKRFQMIGAELRPYSTDYIGPPYDDTVKLGYFKSISFVDNLEIHCNIKEGNKISIPIIILNYKKIEIYKNSSLDTAYPVSFKIKFFKNYSINFWFEIVLPLFLAIGFAFALLKTVNYKTRQNKEFYDFSAFLEFGFSLFSNSANAFFIVALAVCVHTLFVHRDQSAVKLLLPKYQKDLVKILIHISAVLKGLYLLRCLWRITKLDLFFIDWERPRGYDTHITTKSHLDTPSVCSGISARTLLNEGTVSAWRIFFVANQWIQLSLKRKTSSLFQVVVFLTIIEVINNKLESNLQDETMLLAISAFVYIATYTVQIAYTTLLLRRISESPLQQFVDICSITNISVFVLLQDCYGFYIHGRSPHGFADTDMSSMIVQLQRESHNISGKRGLLAGSDHQVFVILSPADLRAYYSKLLTPFLRSTNISQTHFEKEFLNHKSHDGLLEKTAIAYSNINRFFCAFIDHAIKDLDYIIKDKSLIETVLDCEFDAYLTDSKSVYSYLSKYTKIIIPLDKGTFYIDHRQSFDQVLLYGNESQIFLFELFLLLSCFLTTDSLTLAIMLMTSIRIVFQAVFRNQMKNNLSSKTLIDKRFLI